MKLVIASLCLAACYDNPPPNVPRPQLPQVVPGAALDVESHDEDEMRPVTSHDRVCVGIDCSTVSVTHKEHVTVKHASATYGDAKLTLGQAEALGDPTYLTDYDQMTKLAASCQHAAIPKYAGDILATVGMLLIIDGAGTTGAANMPYVYAGGAALAGGIAAYALGLFALGGQDCAPANEIFERHRAEFRAADSNDVEDDLADELERVAKEFNARQAKTSAR
jgi:hypothetical protein